MKIMLTPLLILLSWAAFGQADWIQLDQATIKLRYNVPRGWYIGGYKSSHKCNCTGAATNTSADGTINMVIFYSNQQNIDSLSRQSVWGYNFSDENVQVGRGLESAGLPFVRHHSIWKEDKTLKVVRLKAQKDQYAYVVYFWGTDADLEKHKEEIDKIATSMQMY